MPLQTPRKNPKELHLENEGPVKQVHLFLSTDQDTPCPERYEHDGRGEVR
jgi:hypothetical protein